MLPDAGKRCMAAKPPTFSPPCAYTACGKVVPLGPVGFLRPQGRSHETRMHPSCACVLNWGTNMPCISLQPPRKARSRSPTGRPWSRARTARTGPSCSWGCPPRRSPCGCGGPWPTRPRRRTPRPGGAARARPGLWRRLPRGGRPRTRCTCSPARRLPAPAQSWSESGPLSSGRTKTPS